MVLRREWMWMDETCEYTSMLEKEKEKESQD